MTKSTMYCIFRILSVSGSFENVMGVLKDVVPKFQENPEVRLEIGFEQLR